MIEDGAQIIDIGGESTKPGAKFVSESEEQDRVLPVIEGLVGCGVALSLDSYKASTMQLACKAGIDILNDITGFTSPQNQAVAVANPNVGLCLMHMQNSPQNMQISPHYDDVVEDLRQYFMDTVNTLESKGIVRKRICIDPGLGFGKTPFHNLRLLNQLKSFNDFGLALLIGISRKSTLAKILGSDLESRTTASVAAMLAGIEQGANIVRVHDVKESVQAIKVWMAIKNESF
jgi:dihydropteroate synthase